MKLNGKTAVVTGGGSGLGAGICRAFAREGATIAVRDIDGSSAERVAGEINGVGMAATTWRFDVCDSDAVEAAADEVVERFGHMDVWVNCAGISRIVFFSRMHARDLGQDHCRQPDGLLQRMPGGRPLHGGGGRGTCSEPRALHVQHARSFLRGAGPGVRPALLDAREGGMGRNCQGRREASSGTQGGIHLCR